MRDNAAVRQAAQLMGIGPVGASAAVATVGDFTQFRSGAQFGAWFGMTPRQHSSGGKTQAGRHHQARRHLSAQPADPGGQVGGDDRAQAQPIRSRRWALALRERSGWQEAAVALANKNARILWAVMTKGEAFDAHHVSVKRSRNRRLTGS